MCQKVVIPARCAPPAPEFSLCNESCKPYFNLDSRFTRRCPGMTRKGFTFIELLVVVLIIGILSAVALPQYEIAVMKSKMNSLLPVMRAIKDANEVYYMANGVYVDDLNQLDVSIDGLDTANKVAGRLDFSNNTWIDQYAGSDCPSGNCKVFGGVGIFSQSNTRCYISIYYDHSVRPGWVECGGGHPKCARVCKSLGF